MTDSNININIGGEVL